MATISRLCCNVLQCVAECCSVLQCVAVCCSVLQCVVVYCCVLCCSVLQCVAVCRSVLQCVAVCCSEYGLATTSRLPKLLMFVSMRESALSAFSLGSWACSLLCFALTFDINHSHA